MKIELNPHRSGSFNKSLVLQNWPNHNSRKITYVWARFTPDLLRNLTNFPRIEVNDHFWEVVFERFRHIAHGLLRNCPQILLLGEMTRNTTTTLLEIMVVVCGENKAVEQYLVSHNPYRNNQAQKPCVGLDKRIPKTSE